MGQCELTHEMSFKLIKDLQFLSDAAQSVIDEVTGNEEFIGIEFFAKTIQENIKRYIEELKSASVHEEDS